MHGLGTLFARVVVEQTKTLRLWYVVGRFSTNILWSVHVHVRVCLFLIQMCTRVQSVCAFVCVLIPCVVHGATVLRVLLFLAIFDRACQLNVST